MEFKMMVKTEAVSGYWTVMYSGTKKRAMEFFDAYKDVKGTIDCKVQREDGKLIVQKL